MSKMGGVEMSDANVVSNHYTHGSLLDATAYPGNSGSPLYDPETGEVVGIIH